MRARNLRTLRLLVIGVASAIVLSLIGGTGHAQTSRPLRAVMINDLRSLDPHATSGISVSHAMMVYDTLFDQDEAGLAQLQAVEAWTKSDDGLTYTFTLRPDLVFHDGTPLKVADVIESIRRWVRYSAPGQSVPLAQDSYAIANDRSFTIRLAKPFGFLIDAMASSYMPIFVMREVDAKRPTSEPLTTAIGTGPYKFVQEEWAPGSKAVYVKNAAYVPRKEPASGYAGGHVAKIDRVEWHYMPDYATRVSALKAGEIDLIETIEGERRLDAEADPNVTSVQHPLRGTFNQVIINHLHPPFNHPAGRQALLYIVDQAEVLLAATGSDKLFVTCRSFYVCRSKYSTEDGAIGLSKPDIATAEKLLAEAGYNGEPIVIMMASDQPGQFKAMQVLVSQLRKVKSLNVRPVTMDWGALTTRRASKAPPASGGWSMFYTTGSAPSQIIPIIHFNARAGCEKAWFGWPCDEEAERLRLAWGDAADEPSRAKAAAEAQKRWFSHTVPFVPLGATNDATVYRKDKIKGVLTTPNRTPMWNIEFVR